MARDRGLEEVIREDLAGERGLSEKAMFGGLAWLLDGHLLCAARVGGMLVRLGREGEGWALALPEIAPMVMRGRQMPGWVWAGADAVADDALRRRLIAAAVAFVRTLPAK